MAQLQKPIYETHKKKKQPGHDCSQRSHHRSMKELSDDWEKFVIISKRHRHHCHKSTGCILEPDSPTVGAMPGRNSQATLLGIPSINQIKWMTHSKMTGGRWLMAWMMTIGGGIIMANTS